MIKLSKKRQFCFPVILIIIVLIIFSPYIAHLHTYALFAKSDKIRIRYCDFYDTENAESISKQKEIDITDENDIKTLKKICSLQSITDIATIFDVPACFFDTVEIVFSNGKQQVTVCPSPDGCNNILIRTENGDEYYRSLSKTEMKTLIEILENNGIVWVW